MDEESRKFIEQYLTKLWQSLNLDRPNNWDYILDFVVSDVAESSGYLIDGYFNSEDISIAFRRFVECN
jgi:hypothetical protein